MAGQPGGGGQQPRVALVTGAAQGLGHATARTMAGPATGSEMSAANARPPVRSAKSVSRPSSARSLTATVNPSAASRSAVAWPRPWAAPVIKATATQITAPAFGERTSPQYMDPSVAR